MRGRQGDSAPADGEKPDEGVIDAEFEDAN